MGKNNEPVMKKIFWGTAAVSEFHYDEEGNMHVVRTQLAGSLDSFVSMFSGSGVIADDSGDSPQTDVAGPADLASLSPAPAAGPDMGATPHTSMHDPAVAATSPVLDGPLSTPSDADSLPQAQDMDSLGLGDELPFDLAAAPTVESQSLPVGSADAPVATLDAPLGDDSVAMSPDDGMQSYIPDRNAEIPQLESPQEVDLASAGPDVAAEQPIPVSPPEVSGPTMVPTGTIAEVPPGVQEIASPLLSPTEDQQKMLEGNPVVGQPQEIDPLAGLVDQEPVTQSETAAAPVTSAADPRVVAASQVADDPTASQPSARWSIGDADGIPEPPSLDIEALQVFADSQLRSMGASKSAHEKIMGFLPKVGAIEKAKLVQVASSFYQASQDVIAALPIQDVRYHLVKGMLAAAKNDTGK